MSTQPFTRGILSHDLPPPSAHTPPPTPPSILLLRTLASRTDDGVPITDMLTLATEIGVRPADLVLLLCRGLDAGYLRDDDGVLTLSERGEAWLAHHREG